MKHLRPVRRFALRALVVACAAGIGCLASAASAQIAPSGIAAGRDPWFIGLASELTWNYSLAQIKAPAAFQRGVTGAGQVVAVFDSGLDTKNNQFIGRIAGPGFDAVTGKAGVTADAMWHGTFVSGIIAADRDGIGMVGVAYDAKLLPVRIVNADGSVTLSDAKLAAGIRFATQAKAGVFNNSWNSTTAITGLSKAALDAYMPATLSAYRDAVRGGAIIVFAAGNSGGSQPGFYAALPAVYAELRAGWLAAVATESSGAIASYSNRCGAAAAWCMAAPGSNIVSVYNGGYGTASGTSFAAPALSAAAALLKQEFPYLSNAQILQIMFATANKSGIYANQAIYGQGLLDLDRATKPVGTLTIAAASAGAPSKPLVGTTMALSSAFGNGFAKSLADQPVMARDGFGRGYTVPLGGIVQPGGAAFGAERALASFGGRDMTTVSAGGTTLSVAFASEPQAGGADARLVPGKFLMSTRLDAGRTLDIGYNVSPAWAFGAYGSGAANHGDLLWDAALSIPYLDLAEQAYSVAYGTRLGGLGSVKLGAFFGMARTSPFDVSYYDPTREPQRAGISGLVAELSVPLGERARLAFDGGAIVEQGTFLGTLQSGPMAFGGNTPTGFVGITGDVRLGGGFSLFGGAHLGVSMPSGSNASLIQSVSSVTTESFNFGLAREQVFGERDRAGFVVSRPLVATSGSARLLVPVALDDNANIISQRADAGLAADGRELDLQGFYATPAGEGSSFNVGAMVRLQPDNVRAARPDGVVLSQFKLRF